MKEASPETKKEESLAEITFSRVSSSVSFTHCRYHYFCVLGQHGFYKKNHFV